MTFTEWRCQFHGLFYRLVTGMQAFEDLLEFPRCPHSHCPGRVRVEFDRETVKRALGMASVHKDGQHSYGRIG